MESLPGLHVRNDCVRNELQLGGWCTDSAKQKNDEFWVDFSPTEQGTGQRQIQSSLVQLLGVAVCPDNLTESFTICDEQSFGLMERKRGREPPSIRPDGVCRPALRRLNALPSGSRANPISRSFSHTQDTQLVTLLKHQTFTM